MTGESSDVIMIVAGIYRRSSIEGHAASCISICQIVFRYIGFMPELANIALPLQVNLV